MSYINKAFEYTKNIRKILVGPQPERAAVEAIDRQLQEAKPFFCKITDAFNGTCRFFACVFTFFGIILAFMGKLTMEYCALVTSVQALLVAHSMGQDYHARNVDTPDAPVTKP